MADLPITPPSPVNPGEFPTVTPGASSPGASGETFVATLKDALAKINEAQSSYFKRNRRYALTLDELADAHLINAAPTTAETGYDFTVRPAADLK